VFAAVVYLITIRGRTRRIAASDKEASSLSDMEDNWLSPA
jgi:hypothetical protein